MIVQFKTLDDAIWIADVANLKWARTDKPAVDPESILLDSGALVAQGYGVYVLAGRNPNSPAPGAGLCNFGVMPVVSGTVLDMYLAANVPVKEFTMPAPVTRIEYKIIERPESAPVQPTEVIQPSSPNPLATDASVIDVPESPEILPTAVATCYPKSFAANLKEE